MAQHVIVKEYNKDYPKLYEIEKKLLVNILKDNLVEINHIGSTSIEGLKSKPIIDILITVNSLNDVDSHKKDFENIGYEYMGEFGIKGRRYLRKGGDNRTHQIHIFDKKDKFNVIRHLAFKEYLINHQDIKNEYGHLKEVLAQKYPEDIEKYCDGMESFVKKVEQLAINEFYKNILENIGISLISLEKHMDLFNKAASYFSKIRNIDKEEYIRSFNDSLNTNCYIPKWYLLMKDEEIIGGCGIIENDFHTEHNLEPNLVSLYVEKKYRNFGLAGALINQIKVVAKEKFESLYLLTDLVGFYEQYGFEYVKDYIQFGEKLKFYKINLN